MIHLHTYSAPACVKAGSDPEETYLVLQLVGPTEQETERNRVAIIPVIDSSGSMAGKKITTVKAALSRLSEYLGSKDYLGVVGFDSTARVVFPCSEMKGDSMRKAQEAISRMSPGGVTALFDGVRKALHEAAQIAAKVDLVRIVVLTDGRANVGPTDVDSFKDIITGTDSKISLSFIGVGMDCDHDFLGDLAEIGKGSYGFAETNSDAARALGAEIGGVIANAGANILLTIDPKPGVTVKTPLGFSGGSTRVTLPFVKEGETKTIVYPVIHQIPKKRQVRAVSFCDVTFTYTTGEASHTVTVKPKILFGEVTVEVDDAIQEAIDLAKLADIQVKAEEAARKGDFKTAEALFSTTTFETPSVQYFANNLSQTYSGQATYTTGVLTRNSAAAAANSARGGLVSSSTTFDSMWGRSGRSYLTAEQIEAAADAVLDD